MSTPQPAAGAIGVSVFINIMNARKLKFLQQADAPNDPTTVSEAMIAGVELVYFIAFAMSLVAVLLAFIVRSQGKRMN